MVYRQIYQAILQGLQHKELIPQVTIGKDRLAVRPANRDKHLNLLSTAPADRTAERISDAAESATGRVENRAKAANLIADRTVAVAASGEETHKGSVVREQGTGYYGEKRETGCSSEYPAKQNPNLQAGQLYQTEETVYLPRLFRRLNRWIFSTENC